MHFGKARQKTRDPSVDVGSGQFEFILIGEVGNFLHHFFQGLFRDAVEGRYSFHLKVAFTDHEPAVVEIGCLFQQVLQIVVGVKGTNLGSEGDQLSVVQIILPDVANDGLKPVA